VVKKLVSIILHVIYLFLVIFYIVMNYSYVMDIFILRVRKTLEFFTMRMTPKNV